MERRLILFLVFKAFMQSIHGQSPILDIDNESTDEGSSFTLNCSVAISDAIIFKLDNVAQGSCGAPFLGVLGTCNPNIITQSLADEVTSWTIAPAQIAHRGSWKCTLGTTDSNVVTLTIYKLPVAVLTQNGISSDTTVNDTSAYPISVEVGCLFSENDPTVELEFVAAGTMNASAIMSCSTSSTSCSVCTGCSAYSCSHNISLNQALSSGQITKDTRYTLQIKVGVTGTTQTFLSAVFSPHSITFEGTRALTISRLGSNELESTTYTLKCEIPGFNDQATWSKNGVAVAIFVNGVNTLKPESPYSYRQDSSAIYVDFSTLERIEHNKKWTCAHIRRTDVHFTVQVESSKRVAIESGAATASAGLIVGTFLGVLVTFTPFVFISSAVAKKWYFPNRHVCRGTVVYDMHIAIVGAVCHISSVIITLVVVLRYHGQFNDLVTVFITFLFCITPILGFLGFCCILAIFGKKELIHKIFDNKYERLSLAKNYGVKFTTHNSSMISFKVKTKKDAHMAVFGENFGAPLVDIILGYRDNLRSVVVEPNQREPKDEYRGEVISSTKYNTFYLKCEQNHITLLNGKEEPILTWKSDNNTSIEDIVISNSLQEHAAMIWKSRSRFTKREIQILCLEMNKSDKDTIDNPEKNTTNWNALCSKINEYYDKDNERTADEIRKMWEIIMSTTKGTLAGDSVCQFDADSVLNSYSWIDTGTKYDGSGSPESGEWIIFVRQGDRLDERDDDSRSFKTFLLVIVVLFPMAWLVLPIIGLLRLCIQDNSTSNRANGLPSHGIHECEYSCLRGSFCNKISILDNQFESPDSPPAYSVKYNKSDVANKKNKKSQSVKIEGGDIENTGNMANPSTGNDHDKRLDKNMSNKGNEKQGLTPIQGVNLHIGGESKLNQKPFGTAVPIPPIDSPKKV